MATRNTARAILALCILSLALCGAFYTLGRATPLPDNPYLPLLSAISPDARCYGDVYLYSSYCTLQMESGYFSWSLDNEGGIKSFSTRGVYHVQLGTLVAIYGQPTRINRTRFQVSYSWILESEGLRIVAFSRRGNLFEPIKWILILTTG